MTSAIAGNGVLLQLGSGGTGTESYTTVAEVLDIDGPTEEADDIEVTSHSSNGWREYIGGLKDGGEVSFPVNFVPSEQEDIWDLYDSQEIANWKIVYPNGWRDSFAARVKSRGRKSPVEGAVTVEFKLKISGEVTLDQGT